VGRKLVQLGSYNMLRCGTDDSKELCFIDNLQKLAKVLWKCGMGVSMPRNLSRISERHHAL